ncbi:MAG: GNAT family N-acetyltransferase [Desulfobulbaceae bacterium]|nr:MAG: GNAT family N-acetyltransferase [Desulfobulbaceae bacterium]
MDYCILSNNTYKMEQYSIVPIRKEDIFFIKKWRNEQMTILRQKKLLTDQEQLSYYEDDVVPSFSQVNPKIILFSYLYSDRCIGYGGLTNIEWLSKRAELSFLLDTKRATDPALYEMEFSFFIIFMKKVVFDGLDFNRIFTETYAFRQEHISILEKNGFRFEGRMRQHVMIKGKFVDSLLHGFLKEHQHA